MSYELAEDKKGKFNRKFNKDIFSSVPNFEDWVGSFAFSVKEKNGMCLIYTAIQGLDKYVKQLLDLGVSADFRSRRRCDFPLEGDHLNDVHFNVLCGTTPLHVASTETVTILLLAQLKKKGKSIEIPDASGRTPLVCRVVSNDLNGIELLLKAGANINYKDGAGYSVLHQAVFTNNAQTVNCVFEHNPIMVADLTGNTPRDYAYKYVQFSDSAKIFAPTDLVSTAATAPASALHGFRFGSPVLSGSHKRKLGALSITPPPPVTPPPEREGEEYRTSLPSPT